MRNKLGWALIVGCALWVVLVLLSWIAAAARPDWPIRTLISDTGLRWLVGSMEANIESPLLVWLILGMVSFGSYFGGGLNDALHGLVRRKMPSFRTRMALYLVSFEALLFFVVMVLLCIVPHAPLLSITGSLIPGCLEHGAIPLLCFLIMLCSVSFAVMSGQCRTPSRLVWLLSYGVRRWAWLVPLYVVWMELIASLVFVLNW